MHTRVFHGLARSIPVCGLGGWALGGRGYGPVDRDTARAALIRFIELGGVFIDTAEAYGTSEEIIGEVIAELNCRDRVVLATKTQHHARADIRRSLEQSLRRLRTEVVDVYQIHLPPEDDATMADVLGAYQELQSEGKIRLVGASIKGGAVTDQTVELCRRYIRTGKVQSLQVIYSVLRPRNAAMFAEAARAGVAIIARTILENGFLAGTYRPGHVFPSGDHRQRWSRERLDRILGAVQELGARFPGNAKAVPELAIRFAASAPEVAVIIPGAKTPEQVEQNWRAASGPPVSSAEVELLRRALGGLEELANPGS